MITATTVPATKPRRIRSSRMPCSFRARRGNPRMPALPTSRMCGTRRRTVKLQTMRTTSTPTRKMGAGRANSVWKPDERSAHRNGLEPKLSATERKTATATTMHR
jgi:hypothetical protein